MRGRMKILLSYYSQIQVEENNSMVDTSMYCTFYLEQQSDTILSMTSQWARRSCFYAPDETTSGIYLSSWWNLYGWVLETKRNESKQSKLRVWGSFSCKRVVWIAAGAVEAGLRLCSKAQHQVRESWQNQRKRRVNVFWVVQKQYGSELRGDERTVVALSTSSPPTSLAPKKIEMASSQN